MSAAQVEVPLTRVADSVTTIDAPALEARQIDTIADALRLVPGLTVSRSGSAGGLTSLFPRGGESDFTLVLIDGVSSNAFGGGYDFAHLGSAGIERVEVVRGPQSALYGGGAIGAVVSVVSRRGEPALVDGSFEGGSLGTWRVDGSAAGTYEGWSGAIAAEQLASDGFTGTAPATGEEVSNDDYERHFFALGGGWRGTRGVGLDGRIRVAGNERGFPGPFGSNPVGNYAAVDRISRGQNDDVLFSLDGRVPTGQRWRHRAQVTYADFDSEFVSQFSPDDPTTSESRRFTTRSAVGCRRVGTARRQPWRRVSERAGLEHLHHGQHVPGNPDRSRSCRATSARRATRRDASRRRRESRIEHIRREALEGDPNPFAAAPGVR